MPRKKQLKTKKLAILSIAVIVVVGCSTLIYTYAIKNTSYSSKGSQSSSSSKIPYDKINYGPSSPQDNASNNTRKSNPSSAATTLDNGPTTSTSNSSNYVTVNSASVSGSNLVIKASVSGITSGTCVANVSQSGQTTVTSAAVQVQNEVNYYGCQTIEIPLSQFPNKGNWYVSVAVASGGTTISGQWDNNAAISLTSSN